MTAKEYLMQYRICCRKYDGVLESIMQLRAIAEKTTHTLNAYKVSSSSSDRLGSIASTLADAETDALAELQMLNETRNAVRQAIDNIVHDCKCRKNCICAEQREVLFQRYILQKKWENIAVDLSYDLTWVYDLHGKGLQKIVPQNEQ